MLGIHALPLSISRVQISKDIPAPSICNLRPSIQHLRLP